MRVFKIYKKFPFEISIVDNEMAEYLDISAETNEYSIFNDEKYALKFLMERYTEHKKELDKIFHNGVALIMNNEEEL